MIKDILFSLWFFFPAGFANMAPIFAARIPFLHNYSYPLDCYKKMNNKRILGDHKTIRGIISGIIIGIIMVYFQQYLYNHFVFFKSISIINYTQINIFLFGFLLGFGALFGDAVKSFFKRQFAISEGKSWLFFDQLDYIIGAIVFSLFYIRLTLFIYMLAIILWFLLHVIVSFIGFLMGLKRSAI